MDVLPPLTHSEDSQDALAYLIHYETVVRQQECEDLAVVDYLKGFLGELQMGDDWTVPLDVSHIQRWRQTTSSYQTDCQLMLVLDSISSNNTTATITPLEIYHAYKVTCHGMLVLQHAPVGSELRHQLRNRILASLALPQATMVLNTKMRRPGAAAHDEPHMVPCKSPRATDSSWMKTKLLFAFLFFLFIAAGYQVDWQGRKEPETTRLVEPTVPRVEQPDTPKATVESIEETPTEFIKDQILKDKTLQSTISVRQTLGTLAMFPMGALLGPWAALTVGALAWQQPQE